MAGDWLAAPALKVRRDARGRRLSSSSGGRRPACHGPEFARGAGGSGRAAPPRPHLPPPQPPPRERAGRGRGSSRAPPSAAPSPPAPPARPAAPARTASAPALGLPGWGGNPGCAAPPSRAMVGSGAPRAAHSWEQPPQALRRGVATASRPTWLPLLRTSLREPLEHLDRKPRARLVFHLPQQPLVPKRRG